MKRLRLALACLLLLLPLQGFAAQWKSEVFTGPDGRNMEVYLYVPDTPPKLAGQRALMINLHGCAQTNENLRDLGNWGDTADEYGMVVAIPDVTVDESYLPWSLKCWNYYGTGHTRSYKSNDNLIDLAQRLIENPTYNIDSNQVYISGLSSGGGQTGVMGCLAPELFAGIGINSGPTIGTGPNEIGRIATTKSAAIGLCKRFAGDKQTYFATQLTSLIYGKDDQFVAQGYGDLNAEVMVSLYQASATSEFAVSTLDGYNPDGQGLLWSDEEGPRLSLIKATGLDHAWPAGSGPGGTRNYVRASGVNYPAYLAKFFFENNRRVNSPPEVEITAARQDGTIILVEGTVTDPDPGDAISSVIIKFVDGCNEANVLIDRAEIVGLLNQEGSFSHSIPWPTDNKSYVPLISATDDHSPAASDIKRGNPVSVGTPPAAPSVSISQVEGLVQPKCIGVSVAGEAEKGGAELSRVEIQVDSGDFSVADGISDWKYKKCGLDYGVHNVLAKVSDVEGCSLHSTVAKILLQRPYQEQVGSVISLMSYFDNYPNARYPNAPARGWGLCDKTYVELNSEYGIAGELKIYGTENGEVWCYGSENLPKVVSAAVENGDSCREWIETLDNHESKGRVYSLGWWPWKTYIAKGSNVYLKGSSSTTVTLRENADGSTNYYPGECE